MYAINILIVLLKYKINTKRRNNVLEKNNFHRENHNFFMVFQTYSES